METEQEQSSRIRQRHPSLSVTGPDLKPPVNGMPADVVGNYTAWSQTDRTKPTLSSRLSNKLQQNSIWRSL